MRALALVLVTACWTGAVPDPAPPEDQAPAVEKKIDLEIKFARTPCMGKCPVYSISVRKDGLVSWFGRDNVVEKGERTRKLTKTQMRDLARLVDHVHFFELDNYGKSPQTNQCQTIGKTVTCSFSSSACSDTSHTILTITQPKRNRSHTIDDSHCSDDGAAESLEQAIEALADPWIGNR